MSEATSWEEIWETGPYFDRISRLLEVAEHYAIFAGWQIDSRIKLGNETFKEKIIRICETKKDFHFYLLMWDHAYIYVRERELFQGRVWENIHERVHFVFDNRHPMGASHHEKICIIDGKIAFCGGIDFCDDRWDCPDHFYNDPRRSLDRKGEKHGPYHDMAVQVSGPICEEIQNHIESRWRAISSIPLPKRMLKQVKKTSDHRGHRVFFSRTLADVNSFREKLSPVREVEFLFRDLIQLAQSRIILEGQYYWSKVLNDVLISKIVEMRGQKFKVILILADLQDIKSLTRYMMSYELSLLRRLQEAANFAGIELVMGSPVAMPPEFNSFQPPKPIYIHSKVLIIDDRFLGIGTANFADRALRIDTEIHLTLEARNDFERNHVRQMANNILNHWDLGPVRKKSSIYFRKFQPVVDLKHLRKELKRVAGFRWDKYFDPALPWFHVLKRKIYIKVRQQAAFPVLAMGSCLLLGAVSTSILLHFYGIPPTIYVFSYNFVLSSVWLLPIPFSVVGILAVIQLGPSIGSSVILTSFWSASMMGYFFWRAFPNTASGVLSIDRQDALFQKAGRRTFPDYIMLLFDPRISVRSKLISQGIFVVPFPWFALGSLVLLPAFMYMVFTLIIPLIVSCLFESILSIARDLGNMVMIGKG